MRSRCARVRVDRVVLYPARGDRLGRQRVGHVRLDPSVGEQVREPAPAVRGLERDAERRRRELAEDALERLGPALDPPAEDRGARLVEGRDD